MKRLAFLVLLLGFQFVAMGPAQEAVSSWDKKGLKSLDDLAARFWKARPKDRFGAWDAEQRRALMAEAQRFADLPAGKTQEIADRIFKAFRRHGTRHGKAKGGGKLKTPYGAARFIVRGKGKTKRLLIGLHGGGEGAGDMKEAAGNWNLSNSLAFYPQGIKLVHDTWNTIHGERFLLSLIEIAKLEYGVDPDHVYCVGFSMGGTGSWFMAGRHPDLLAGAIPAAGVLMARPKSQVATKEEVKDVQHGLVPNIRNLAVYSYIGLSDRNCMPGTFLFVEDMVKEWKAEDPKGYGLFKFKTIKGLAHAFPAGEPATGLKYITSQARQTFPKQLTWEYVTRPFPRREKRGKQKRFVKNDFYWLHCKEPKDRQVIRAKRTKGLIEIESEGSDADNFAVWLNDTMIAKAQEIVVRFDDEEKFRGLPPRRLETLLESIDARADRRMIFDRRIDL